MVDNQQLAMVPKHEPPPREAHQWRERHHTCSSLPQRQHVAILHVVRPPCIVDQLHLHSSPSRLFEQLEGMQSHGIGFESVCFHLDAGSGSDDSSPHVAIARTAVVVHLIIFFCFVVIRNPIHTQNHSHTPLNSHPTTHTP